jgi:hypothetical protein
MAKVPTMRKIDNVRRGGDGESVLSKKLAMVRRAAAGERIDEFEFWSVPHESVDGAYMQQRRANELRLSGARSREVRMWMRGQSSAPKAPEPETGHNLLGHTPGEVSLMKISEIRDLAMKLGIPGWEDMSKNELLDALLGKE